MQHSSINNHERQKELWDGRGKADQQRWYRRRWESVKNQGICYHNSFSMRIFEHIFQAHFKISFINSETEQKADSFLKSICYRSAESLVSLQSILAHQRSVLLEMLNKCKRGDAWGITRISRSRKKQNMKLIKWKTKTKIKQKNWWSVFPTLLIRFLSGTFIFVGVYIYI